MSELYQKLQQYSKSNFYPYHMPGHKRQSWGQLPQEIAEMDITEIDGFDNLHQPAEILAKLQAAAAKLYGAEKSYYLINGSTCGILSAISAAVPEGGHILMARNCHKSAYHAAYLRNLTVSYLYPPMIPEYDIFGAIRKEQVKEALEENPDIAAVLLVSPTYEGRIADIKSIAEIVHEKGIPLLVDEAHGAHLGLAENFPQNSCRQGADIVIHSVHKTLPAMTQTALLHVNGELIHRDRLERFLHIYQSSSPSYILMGSIDNALSLVREHGKELFRTFRESFCSMMEKLSQCRVLQFIFPGEGQDIGKLIISGKRIGLSGQRIYDILLQEYHLQPEMAAGSYCLAMFTVGDKKEAYERMESALLELDERLCQKGYAVKADKEVCEKADINGNCIKAAGQTPLSLKAGWDAEWETVPLREAVGRQVAEFVNLYPPGIPLLVPGEQLLKEQYCQIKDYLEQGLNVQGLEKGEKSSVCIRVLCQKKIETRKD